jgi:hypothetical protein
MGLPNPTLQTSTTSQHCKPWATTSIFHLFNPTKSFQLHATITTTAHLYDTIYKTNNKKLVLSQVVGLNNLGTAYSMRGFINNETQEGFEWLMGQVERVR